MIDDLTIPTRCWIFGSSRPLRAEDPLIADRLAGFMGQWQSHGLPVAGQWEILHERFLIILQTGQGAEATGCSIDSMVGEVKILEEALQTQLLDSSRIFYRNPGGKVESVARPEFKRLAKEGVITPETEVFDTTLTRLADLRPGLFSKPVRDSWHMKLYENSVK